MEQRYRPPPASQTGTRVRVEAATVRGVDRGQAARELGIPLGAPSMDVERAYRAAARVHHPDVGGDALAFRRVTEARAVLLAPRATDPFTRLADVVEVIVRYPPAVLVVEALVRVVDRRPSAR